jgi:hypothetical protein
MSTPFPLLSIVLQRLPRFYATSPPQRLLPIAPGEFDAGELGRIVFLRDSDGRVSNLTVFIQEVRGIDFQKTD